MMVAALANEAKNAPGVNKDELADIAEAANDLSLDTGHIVHLEDPGRAQVGRRAAFRALQIREAARNDKHDAGLGGGCCGSSVEPTGIRGVGVAAGAVGVEAQAAESQSGFRRPQFLRIETVGVVQSQDISRLSVGWVVAPHRA